MGELEALLVQFVLLDWVYHMLLDPQDFSILFYDVTWGGFWNGAKHFFDISVWSRKNREFLGIKDILKGWHLLEKPFKVKSSLIDELNILVSNGLLWREHWKWNSWPSLVQFLVKLVEFIVSSIALPHALGVRSLALIDDVTAFVLGVSALETLFWAVINQFILLIKDVII